MTRPDKTVRTLWRQEVAASDQQEPTLEVVLPEAAELTEIASGLLTPGVLPSLWPATNATITVAQARQYFGGENVVQLKVETANGQTYEEPVVIPKAAPAAVETAIGEAVAAGRLWLRSGAASICGETIPTGVLNDAATLCAPPASIDVHDLLPGGLPEAWKDGETTALGLSASLSQKSGNLLPWSTVREAIDGALRARVMEQAVDSGVWPSPLSGAAAVKLRLPTGDVPEPQPAPSPDLTTKLPPPPAGVRMVEAELSDAEIQDLGEIMGELLGATVGVDLKFRLRLELGPGVPVANGKLAAINTILRKVSAKLELH